MASQHSKKRVCYYYDGMFTNNILVFDLSNISIASLRGLKVVLYSLNRKNFCWKRPFPYAGPKKPHTFGCKNLKLCIAKSFLMLIYDERHIIFVLVFFRINLLQKNTNYTKSRLFPLKNYGSPFSHARRTKVTIF